LEKELAFRDALENELIDDDAYDDAYDESI
jgi:hypothetical protein